MNIYIHGYGLCGGVGMYDPKLIYNKYNIQCESVFVNMNSLVVNNKEVANITGKNNINYSVSNHIAKILLGVETI